MSRIPSAERGSRLVGRGVVRLEIGQCSLHTQTKRLLRFDRLADPGQEHSVFSGSAGGGLNSRQIVNPGK